MTPTESPKLSLWTIENALVELIQAREEVEALGEQYEDKASELAEIDKAIAQYIRAEVGKVDNIRGFLKHAEMMRDAAKAEADAQANRARAWERRIDRVKGIVYDVMGEAGKKRIDGQTGYFLVKGNGGLQPLLVTDEAAVPEECCKYVGWIGGELWRVIRQLWPMIERRLGPVEASDYRMARTVDNERTRDMLKSACSGCNGAGNVNSVNEPGETVQFVVCCGSGTEPVPGARLGEMGSHLEVK